MCASPGYELKMPDQSLIHLSRLTKSWVNYSQSSRADIVSTMTDATFKYPPSVDLLSSLINSVVVCCAAPVKRILKHFHQWATTFGQHTKQWFRMGLQPVKPCDSINLGRHDDVGGSFNHRENRARDPYLLYHEIEVVLSREEPC